MNNNKICNNRDISLRNKWFWMSFAQSTYTLTVIPIPQSTEPRTLEILVSHDIITYSSPPPPREKKHKVKTNKQMWGFDKIRPILPFKVCAYHSIPIRRPIVCRPYFSTSIPAPFYTYNYHIQFGWCRKSDKKTWPIVNSYIRNTSERVISKPGRDRTDVRLK